MSWIHTRGHCVSRCTADMGRIRDVPDVEPRVNILEGVQPTGEADHCTVHVAGCQVWMTYIISVLFMSDNDTSSG